MLKWFGLFGFGCQQNSWFSTSCLSRGLTHQTHQNQKLPAATHLYHGSSPQTARPLLPTDCSQRPFITGPFVRPGQDRGRAWKQKDGPAHTSRALRLPGEPPRPGSCHAISKGWHKHLILIFQWLQCICIFPNQHLDTRIWDSQKVKENLI